MRTRTSLLRDILDILDILACHIYSFSYTDCLYFFCGIGLANIILILFTRSTSWEWMKPFCCAEFCFCGVCLSCSLIVRKCQELGNEREMECLCYSLCFESLPSTLLSFINHNLLKLKQPTSQPHKSQLIKERTERTHFGCCTFKCCCILSIAESCFAFRESMWMFVA